MWCSFFIFPFSKFEILCFCGFLSILYSILLHQKNSVLFVSIRKRIAWIFYDFFLSVHDIFICLINYESLNGRNAHAEKLQKFIFIIILEIYNETNLIDIIFIDFRLFFQVKLTLKCAYKKIRSRKTHPSLCKKISLSRVKRFKKIQ